MKNNIFFSINLCLSILLLIWFGGFTINDFLTVGDSYFWLICYSGPFFLALLFAALSFRFKPEKATSLKYLPLVINVLTVIVSFCLFEFNYLNPDFSFLRLYKDYSRAASLIENGQIPINQDGFALLPENLTQTSLTGYVYVTTSTNLTTVYFLYDAENFDGYSWGYLYRSDGSEPPLTDKQNLENCYRWRPIKPVTSKWFYCQGNRIYSFPSH